METVFPDVEVELSGTDGNAFAILGKVSKAIKSAGHSPDEFLAEAKSGDYDHLLQTCFKYVEVS